MAFLSRNKYKIQEVISAGKIGGLLTPDNPLHSIYLDGTPMARANGESNVRGANVIMRDGTVDQDVVPGFENLAQTKAGSGTMEPYVWQTVQIDSGFDRARIIVRSPGGIYKFSSKGKYQSWLFAVDIEVSTDQSSWVSVARIRENHRTQQDFDFSQLVENPSSNAGNTWYVRVQRASNYGNQRESWSPAFQAYVQLGYVDNEDVLKYANTAYASVEFDSSQFGTGLPTRGYRFKGIECLVPDTYQPTEYDRNTGVVTKWASYSSSIWDGTLVRKHCDDPAWIAYTMLVDPVWGAGRTVDASAIDVYDFHAASLYNVALVDDGHAPVQPRFLWNGRLASINNMRQMVADVLACCNAAIYEEDGIVKLYQDRPANASAILCRANVVAGEMTFSSAPLDGRYSAVEITYNDRTNNMEPRTELVTDDTVTAKYGYRQVNISQNGVIDRQQAIRAARWQIENGLSSAQAMTCSVGWENWHLGIGDIALIVDETIYQNAIQARVSMVTDNLVFIRTELPRTFASENIYISTDAGLKETTGTGAVGDMVIQVADATNIKVDDTLVVTADTLPMYRVNGFKYSGGQKQLNFALYDPTKYARIEKGEPYNPVYPPVETENPNKVRDLNTFGFISERIPTVVANWRAPVSLTDASLDAIDIAYYQINATTPDGTLAEQVSETEWVHQFASFGQYTVEVVAVDNFGRPSPRTTQTFNFEIADVSPLKPPASISGSFTAKDVNVNWVDNPDNFNATELSVDAFVVSYGTTQGVVSRTVRIPVTDDHASSTQYKSQYNFDDNNQDNDPASRVVWVSVQVEDNMGQLSPPVQRSFSNAAPLAPQQTLVAGLTNFVVELKPDATLTTWEDDVVGFVVEVGGTQYDVGNQTVISFPADPNTTYNVRSAVYDIFGKTSLNWSPTAQVKTIDFPAPPSLPDTERREFTFSGLNFTWMDGTTGAPTGRLAWSSHTAFRKIITTDPETGGEGALTTQTKNVAAGSVAFNAATQYIYYDWDANTIKSATFDGWYGLDHYLHGLYKTTAVFDAVSQVAQLTADKIAANAIATTHIQADAVVAENIRTKEKIQIGGDRNNNNFGLILDGTATQAGSPVIWAGDNVASGGAANFAVTRAGDIYSRGDFVTSGNATIGGTVNITGNGVIGGNMKVEGLVEGGGLVMPKNDGSKRFEITSAGRARAWNNDGTVMLDLNPVAGVFEFHGKVSAEQIVGDVIGGAGRNFDVIQETVYARDNTTWITVMTAQFDNKWVERGGCSLQVYFPHAHMNKVSTTESMRIGIHHRVLLNGTEIYSTVLRQRSERQVVTEGFTAFSDNTVASGSLQVQIGFFVYSPISSDEAVAVVGGDTLNPTCSVLAVPKSSAFSNIGGDT